MIPSRELAIAVLATSAVLLFLTRGWSPQRRLVVEIAVLAIPTAMLVASGVQPLPSADLVSERASAWPRLLRVAWWIVAARLSATSLNLVLGLRHVSRQARLLNDLLTAALYFAATLVVLNSVLGLRIGGLVATSGVVAIVFGLALQTTLADLFSGVALGLELPFHIGDRVELADGAVEGNVAFMSWRSVRVLTDGNDVVTIPNSLVAKSRIMNRTACSEERATKIEVTTHAGWPATEVIERFQEAMLLTPGVLEEPAPTVLLVRVGQRLNGYAMLFHVANGQVLPDVRSRLLAQVQRQIRHGGLDERAAPHASAILKSLMIFEALDEAQLSSVANAAVRRRFEPGEDLFAQGDASTSVFVLARGVVEIRRQSDPDLHHVGRIGPGEYIGEIGMLTGQPRPAAAHALTPVAAFELRRELFRELISQHPALGPLMQASVERGLRLLARDPAALAIEAGHPHISLLARVREFFAQVAR